MEVTHGAGPSSWAPPPPPAVPSGGAGHPAAAGDGGGSFFRRLPAELLPRVLGGIQKQDLGRLRLCDRATRDAVDARGWGRLTVRCLAGHAQQIAGNVRAACAAARGLPGRDIRLAHLSLSLPMLYSRDGEDMAALYSLFSAMDVAALELVGEPSAASSVWSHDTAGRLASVLARLPGLRDLDAWAVGDLLFSVRVSRHALAAPCYTLAHALHPLPPKGPLFADAGRRPTPILRST
jgi:hypothetical protein